MRNRIISGSLTIGLGGLIALGPQYLFQVCEPMGEKMMKCYWTARAELGIGLLIVILGIAILALRSLQVRLGLNISLLLVGILALSIPTLLIGVCKMSDMKCVILTLPSLQVLSILTILSALINIIYLHRKAKGLGEQND